MAQMRSLIVLSGIFLAGASVAFAQVGVSGVNLSETPAAAEQPSVEVSASEGQARFAAPTEGTEAPPPRRLELEFAATGESAGLPLDISVAQRASIGSGAGGDINREGRGSEVRVGRGLVQQREGAAGGSSMYMFVASDDEALTWSPGQRSEFGGADRGGFALQDRVEVGDVSAGVTYERGNVQASIAYVEREVSATVGRESFSKDESFTGVTLTMRR